MPLHERAALIEGGEKHGFQFTELRAVVGPLQLFQQPPLIGRELLPQFPANGIPFGTILVIGGFVVVLLQNML